ncbi:MAG: hypothetical protein ACRCYS_11475 [Beijerinckiaceae bacterium]
MFALDGVFACKPSDTHWLLLNKHYAKRLPVIQYAFALWSGGQIAGVCTFGPPSSAPLRRGLLGAEFQDRVIELNRLCLDVNYRNMASRLVGASLRLLPRPLAVVSFADTAQSHLGIVYQATNFHYCGLSAKRTDWKLKGAEHLHGQSVADEFRGFPNRAAAMKAKYGDAFYLAPRSRKHRYVYFCGSKKQKREMMAALRYKIEPYPKSALDGIPEIERTSA